MSNVLLKKSNALKNSVQWKSPTLPEHKCMTLSVEAWSFLPIFCRNVLYAFSDQGECGRWGQQSRRKRIQFRKMERMRKKCIEKSSR